MSADDLTERLDLALDAVLTVRLALGGQSGLPMPEDALDAALRLHQGFQQTRRDFVATVDAVQRAGADNDAVLDIEAAAHAMVSQAAEVGWGLACLTYQVKP